MSSKSAKCRRATRPTGPRAGTWSLTGRLTCLYVVSAGGILVLATVVLYGVLARSLAQEGAQFVADMIHVLREVLRDHPQDWEALQEEVQSEVAARQHIKYAVRVLDPHGETLLETLQMAQRLPPALFPAPVGALVCPEDGVQWRVRQGRVYYVVAAWAPVGRNGNAQYLLQVGLDVSRHAALLAHYRRQMVLVLVVGLVLSTGAAVGVARHGLRPLVAIAHAAQGVTATQLQARLGSVHWPRELRVLATTFDAMLDRLEDAFTRLTQCAADLAHELRTPLHNLMGEAEVALVHSRSPAEYQHVLESSLEEYARLAHLIDSVLFLARADSPETRIQCVPLDARHALDSVRAYHEAVAAENGVEVHCQGEARVHADPVLFARAVSNLLANALRHTPRGGHITLAVTTAEDHTVLLRIHDTGSGIAPEALPRIFDRFYRGAPAPSSERPGMGLGLAIVKSIMTLHGGTVTIQSTLSLGTTATLTFPGNSNNSDPSPGSQTQVP